MTAIEALNLPLEPEPNLSRLRQYELGLYTPETPDDLLSLIREARVSAAQNIGQLSLQLVSEV